MEKTAKLPEKTGPDGLMILEQAWAYYMPEPMPAKAGDDKQPDLFQYCNAA